ncbi:DUF7507 domain-containing protein [Paenibacillus kobensis]|uniref:DUF7507 domain-containing protein n=1 Tax=Paenibacillus kobensis TaxID=59841 RepID=UPI000FD9F1FF|nr:choice-of-anchor A family protein [Paenibacillus kobensis]
MKVACENLGIANDFNVFVFEDHIQSFVDSEGRVAVGGNAVYRNYGIGNKLTLSTTRNDLIVGGSMDIIGGTNFSGNSVISPTGAIINYTMTNNNGVPGQPLRQTPFDFEDAEFSLTCASSSWAAVAPNGTVSVNFGQIVLTGSDPSLNVFTIDGNNVAGSGFSLSSVNGINIVTPPGSTVLINIAGTNIGFGNYSIFINGNTAIPSDGRLILWNLFEATTAFNLNLSIKGSVLAPSANWSAIGFGNIDGTIVARSLRNTTGTLEAHNIPFIGCLPQLFCAPQLAVRKTVNGVASFSGTPGTLIEYRISVTNTGGGTLTNVQVTDPLLGFSQLIPSLQSGREVIFTVNSQVPAGAPGTIQQNIVTAASDQTPEATATTTVTVTGSVSILFDKSVDRLTAAPGETVTYQFRVDNIGGIPLQNARLIDPLLGVDLLFPSFLSGVLTTVTFTIPASTPIGTVITNTATLTADNLPNPAASQTSVTVTEIPAVRLAKSADRSSAAPGEAVTYTITVTNDSLVTTLTNLQLTDNLLGLNETINQLTPGSVVQFTGVFTVPPGTPAGSPIINTSTLTSELGSTFATVEVIVGALPGLTVTKNARRTQVAPGDIIIYDIVVTNTGNVPLTNVAINDPSLGFSLTIPQLPVGSVQSFSLNSPVPPDTPAGTNIFNTVFVASDQTGTVETTSEVIVQPVFSIGVQKTADRNLASPGETVTYTVLVSNTSNGPITNVRISDPTLGLNQVIDTMEAGEILIFTLPFTIPAGTLAGTILTNIVTANANETPVRTATALVTVAAVPSLTLQKSVVPNFAFPGETVTFTLSIRNTGNTPLTTVSLTDTDIGVDITLPLLNVGESSITTVPFTLPVAIPPGTVFTNTATALSDQTPSPVTASAQVFIGTPATLVLTKTVSATAALPGQTVTFQTVLTNTSSVTLTNIVLISDLFGLTHQFPELAPGGSETLLEDFEIPANAINGTVFVNNVTATSDQTAEVTASASVTAAAAPSLSISKSANVGTAQPDQSVLYTIIVTNTGNAPLSNVQVSDPTISLLRLIPLLAIGASVEILVPFQIPATALPGSIFTNTIAVVSEQTGVQSTEAEIAIVQTGPFIPSAVKLASVSAAIPGQTVTYMITVHNPTMTTINNITVSDPAVGLLETIATLLSGETVIFEVPFVVPLGTPQGTVLNNTVTVTSPGGASTSSQSIVVLPNPILSLSKTSNVTSALPGQIVLFTLTVTNTGNTVLTNVQVTDTALGFATTIPLLPIGESRSFEVPFIVPAAPIGTIFRNTAFALSDETPVPVEAEASFSVGAAPALGLSKTVNVPTAVPGETVIFTIVAANTSTAPLTNVNITDSLLGFIAVIPFLAPGTSESVTAEFVIPLQSPAGTVFVNTATATSDQSLTVTASSSVVTAAAPALSLLKTVNTNLAAPGETVTYFIFIENTGNVPLTNVQINDPLFGLSETVTVIQPRTTLRLTVPFAIPLDALADVRIFDILNVGTDQTPVQSTISELIVASRFSVDLRKTANVTEAQPGSTVTFTTTVTNTSNQKLTNLNLIDLLTSLNEVLEELHPGETATLTTSVVVPPFAEPGSLLTNTVTLSTGETAPQSASASVVVQALARASLDKMVVPTSGKSGEKVLFTIQLRNTGNVPLVNVRLTDPLLGLQVQIVRFDVRAIETLRTPFVLPEVEEDTKLVNVAALVSDNGPTLEARASVVVIPEEEE